MRISISNGYVSKTNFSVGKAHRSADTQVRLLPNNQSTKLLITRSGCLYIVIILHIDEVLSILERTMKILGLARIRQGMR